LNIALGKCAIKIINNGNGSIVFRGAKKKAQQLLRNDRANYIAKADYSENSEIDKIVKGILDDIGFWWCN
jgi:hypothetical protein